MTTSLPVDRMFRTPGLVKICGLREPEHAVVAAEAGADLLGFIFAPGRRRVTPQQAERCIEAARRAHHAVGRDHDLLSVGVFVDARPDEIVETVRQAGLDLVQLHGSEPPGFADSLPVPTIKVFKPGPFAPLADTVAAVSTFFASVRPPIGVLIEGSHPAGAGGTGALADWTVARMLASQRPTLLAGGLTPSNVGEAIATVRPLGVDVSSGVERDGVKDPDLIAAFVATARAAFGTGDTSCPGS